MYGKKKNWKKWPTGIEQAVPAAEVAGDRYAAAEMKMPDSEK